jgi:hypothetical protein
MSTFPNLTQGPNTTDWTEEAAFDPTLRSQFEGGQVLTRAHCTAVPKKWHLVYDHLTQADKDSLTTFEGQTVLFGADSFEWENTQDGVTYNVRFMAPIKFSINPRSPNYPADKWKAEFDLVEAIPDYSYV